MGPKISPQTSFSVLVDYKGLVDMVALVSLTMTPFLILAELSMLVSCVLILLFTDYSGRIILACMLNLCNIFPIFCGVYVREITFGFHCF